MTVKIGKAEKLDLIGTLGCFVMMGRYQNLGHYSNYLEIEMMIKTVKSLKLDSVEMQDYFAMMARHLKSVKLGSLETLYLWAMIEI